MTKFHGKIITIFVTYHDFLRSCPLTFDHCIVESDTVSDHLCLHPYAHRTSRLDGFEFVKGFSGPLSVSKIPVNFMCSLLTIKIVFVNKSNIFNI